LEGTGAIENLRNVLSNSPWNSSFAKSLEQYAIYNIFTGDRAVPDEYYSDASILPEIRTKDLSLSTSRANQIHIEINPLSLYYTKYSIADEFANFSSKIKKLSGENLSHFQLYYPNNSNYSIQNISNEAWSDDVYLNGTAELIHISSNASIDLNGACTITVLPQMDFLMLSPNPIILSDYTLNMNFFNSQLGDIEFVVYNILGQTVHTETRNLNAGFIETSIQFQNPLPAGIYFLQVLLGETPLTQKFTVLK